MKKIEPNLIKIITLNSFEKLIQEIDNFQNRGDHQSVDNVEIRFYDNGKIEITGDFVYNNTEEICL